MFGKYCGGRIWAFIPSGDEESHSYCKLESDLEPFFCRNPKVKLVKEEKFLPDAAAGSLCVCGLCGFVWTPVWPLSVYSSCHMAPFYLHRRRPTPQTAASSSVHRGGELALVIRAESEWGEQRRAVVLHDFWQAWLRRGEQSWHKRTTHFLFFGCKCTKVRVMCDVAKCKGLLLDDWAPREASTRTFEANLQLTNGRRGKKSTINEHLLAINSFPFAQLGLTVQRVRLCLAAVLVSPPQINVTFLSGPFA